MDEAIGMGEGEGQNPTRPKPSRTYREWTTSELKLAKLWRSQGLTRAEIAKRLGRTLASIKAAKLREGGAEPKPRRVHYQPPAKISIPIWEELQRIRARLGLGAGRGPNPPQTAPATGQESPQAIPRPQGT